MGTFIIGRNSVFYVFLLLFSMNDPLIPIVSTELPFTVQPKIRGVDMDFSDEFLVNNYIPVFSERLIYSSVIVIGGSLFPLFF